MENSELIELENLFLALSDKTRLRLVALMASGPVSVGYLAEQLGESQPKISRHLAILRSSTIAKTTRDGKWIYYQLNKQQSDAANEILRIAADCSLGPYKRKREKERKRAMDRTDIYGYVHMTGGEVEGEDEFEGVSGNADDRRELEVFLL